MKKWIKAIRLEVHSASLLPAILGSVLAFYETGHFSALLFVLTLLGIGFIHAGANLINDYCDYLSGADAANTEYASMFTGGSRVIIEGILAPKKIRNAAIFCFIVGGLIGVILFILTGPMVLWLTLFGIVTAIIYITPKFNLINLGLGELIVGLDFGVLIVLGAYYVQVQSFSFSAFMVSLPIAIVIAAILFINEFQDYKSDKEVGKITTIVRIGRKKGTLVLGFMLGATVLFVTLDILLEFIPLWGFISILCWPLFYHAIGHTVKHYDEPQILSEANLSVIMGQLQLSLYLIIAFLVPSNLLFLLLVLPVAVLSFKTMKQVHIL